MKQNAIETTNPFCPWFYIHVEEEVAFHGCRKCGKKMTENVTDLNAVTLFIEKHLGDCVVDEVASKWWR